MKAQITLDALIATAIGLCLLLVAAAAVQRLSSAQEGSAGFLALKNSGLQLANSADEICAMGEGNARVVPLLGSGFSISADYRGIKLEKGGLSFSRKTACPALVEGNLPFKEEAFLWYEDSHVVISPEPNR